MIGQADTVVVCVPTPLSNDGGPDLGAVHGATKTIAEHLCPGTLVVLESTTYPGTTDEIVRPILEEGGLVAGKDSTSHSLYLSYKVRTLGYPFRFVELAQEINNGMPARLKSMCSRAELELIHRVGPLPASNPPDKNDEFPAHDTSDKGR